MDVPMYSLEYNPFYPEEAPSSFTFVSKDYQEMEARLHHLVERRGPGLFTAPPGMGKSHCLRMFAEELDPSRYNVIYLTMTTVSISDFYSMLSRELGLDGRGRKSSLFQQFQLRVQYLFKEQKAPLVLIIDEAQFLSDRILHDLQMLMNHNYDSEKLFTLILSGEPALNQRLSEAQHDALRQRLTVHYNFRGLDETELAEYVFARIELAGGTRDMIEPGALDSVWRYTRGIPRLIDNVMGYAIMVGCQRRSETIGPDITAAAVNAQLLK